MFDTILHANGGSAPAFNALDVALGPAKQNGSEPHLVSVMEVDYLPGFVEDVGEETGRAARRFRVILTRAHAMAEKNDVRLHPYILTRHPVRDVVKLAIDLQANLPAIGATGHSALYERMIGSRADRMVQLAHRPVLVVK
jgi:nucleotide-binding universal stress UspA family protein